MTNPEAIAPEEGGAEQLEIPPNVLVGCPMTGKLVRLEKCTACPHFAGLLQRFPDEAGKPFAVQYLLRCNHPRNLPLQEFEA